MDIKKIIESTRKYNLHSHTQYCDGKADIKTMAAAAVASGMLHYGFTPHSPIPIESPCNMSLDSVEDYLSAVEDIRNNHTLSSCKFYAGMEIDYLGDSWGPAVDYFKNLSLDYSIASVHFIPTQDGDFVDIDGRPNRFIERMKSCFRDDIEYVVHTFFHQTKKMIAAGGFDILGHFDKISHNASVYKPGILQSSFYKECLEKVIKTILDNNICIELNTKARSEYGFFFPNPDVLPRLVGKVDIVVNSDAHYPERINSSRDEAFALLDSLHGSAKN